MFYFGISNCQVPPVPIEEQLSGAIGIDFLLSKFRGGEMFLQVWLNLIIFFQSGILPPNSVKDQKTRSSPHSESISVLNFGFLVAKWVLLAKKPRGPDIFRPLQC